MSSSNKFLDDAGERVVRFVSAARNLSRLGELTDEIVEIANSGAWRRYRTAVGTDEWRECELDYFLIACDLSHEDIARIAAYTREGAALAPLMDREANHERRRTLEEASATWHAPTPETLLERAQRLGWTRGTSTTLRVAPVPERTRARQAHGITMDEHARRGRAERIAPDRRRQLDAFVEQLRGNLADELERRYVVDRLRSHGAAHRPSTGESERERWRTDAERLEWDTARLASEWGVSVRTAERRVANLR